VAATAPAFAAAGAKKLRIEGRMVFMVWPPCRCGGSPAAVRCAAPAVAVPGPCWAGVRTAAPAWFNPDAG
jgi:hypothetical protein